MPDRLTDMSQRLAAVADRQWTFRLEQLGRPELPFWRLRVPHRGRLHTRLCMAAGIHGDEPAGVEALLRLLEGEDLPHGVAIDCFPCMNPSGVAAGRREDTSGVDLNRLFGAPGAPEPVGWFERATEGLRYDLYVDLHEDSRTEAFYLFETPTGDHRLAPTIARALCRAGIPLEPPEHLRAHIAEDGFDQYGPFDLAPGVAMPTFCTLPPGGLPQAVFMSVKRGAHVMTLESPSQLAFEARVRMHLAGLRALFGELKRRSQFAPLNPTREWLASEPRGRPR